jgi:hypothetical protein
LGCEAVAVRESDQDWDDAAPRPEALVESLRSFGYSPETAVADLLDNSISAGSRHMRLHLVWDGHDSHVAILDDGNGMDESTLLEAMRPGSISPLKSRGRADLGRFGLGLKTASFSQARELTVITRTPDSPTVHIRRWDLDLVAASGQWRLLRTAAPQGDVYADLVRAQGGTAIVWTKCDRLVGDLDRDPERAVDRFYKVADDIRAHLGMTFHRFLVGRGARSMVVNANQVEAWDPILKHDATHQVSPVEKLPFRGTTVRAVPYVLPHRSKLDEKQQQVGAGIRGWTAQQGFYVYRNDRLVVAGDWLGVGGAKDEHTKLARIVVDFDSELDLDWQIDVKKSTARPPGTLLPDLKRIAAATRRSAEEVYRHRGTVVGGRRPTGERPLVTAWQEYKERSGELRLRLNRSHPVISEALTGPAQQKRAVERTLRFVEETLPTSLIGIRLAEALDRQATPYEARPDELRNLLDFVLKNMTDAGTTRAEAFEQLRVMEPFSNFPALVRAAEEGEA